MRQIVLDTETTGLDIEDGHRIIEIGCVELFDRRLTGITLHRYLNVDRDIDDGAYNVHGIDKHMLDNKPSFGDIWGELCSFIKGTELIIHNAPFDIGFLNNELSLLAPPAVTISEYCTVFDTLLLARRLYPGRHNSLDALCKRYQIDNNPHRQHGALRDAESLASVYLAMTGGQTLMTLGALKTNLRGENSNGISSQSPTKRKLPVIYASAAELQAHDELLSEIDTQSQQNCVWRKLGI